MLNSEPCHAWICLQAASYRYPIAYSPIAEIRPLRQPRTRKRPIGLAAGEFTIPASFFDPLPEDLVAAFAGQSEVS